MCAQPLATGKQYPAVLYFLAMNVAPLLSCVLLIACVLCHPTPQIQAADSPAAQCRVAAVAPLDVATPRATDQPLGELVGQLLAIALADHKTLVVVERDRLKDILVEQNLTLKGLTDPRQAAKIGKLLQADVVVSGSIVQTDDADGLRLAINVIAVDGQFVVGTVQQDTSRAQLDAELLGIAAKVAKLAGSTLPEVRSEDLDDSPEGRLHLMRGISLYYANNPAEAIVSCLRAVQRDPRLIEARLWIARSYLKLDEPAHARAELERLAGNTAAAELKGQIEKLLGECKAPTTDKTSTPSR